MAKPFKLEEAPLPKVAFASVNSPDLREILAMLEDSEGESYLCHEISNPYFVHYVEKSLDGAPGMSSWGVLAWIAREARRADQTDDPERGYFVRFDLLKEAFVEVAEGYYEETAMRRYRQRWIAQMIADISAILEDRKGKAAA